MRTCSGPASRNVPVTAASGLSALPRRLIASGLAGRKAIVIFGYDYNGCAMDSAIEAFETLASERVIVGERREATYDHLVTDVTGETLRLWHESKGWDAPPGWPTRESDETVEPPKNEG